MVIFYQKIIVGSMAPGGRLPKTGGMTLVDITIAPDALVGYRSRNDPTRTAWFQDLGLGLFVHWGLDVQYGTVISHWMCGADTRLVDRFIAEGPGTLEAPDFDAGAIARLARLAGMRYLVFTTKHHSGFCWWPTATTGFQVGATPLARDVTGELIAACRRQGLAYGHYFSPYDLWWCRQQRKALHFATPEVVPANNPGLMAHNRAQVRELLTTYGPIDLMFFDGPPEVLRDDVWDLQPNCLVTRGAMATPEQHLPEHDPAGPWEYCVTIGDGWSYKPTNDTTKSGGDLIRLLIETRARGGNLLLNITPDSRGRVPVEQERMLEELGTWMFFNSEAIHGVRPWVVRQEPGVRYTGRTEADGSTTVYAFLDAGWPYGERREIVLGGVATGPASIVEIVGQNGQVLEHDPDREVRTRWTQEDRLHISAVCCYRPYDNRRWANPVALRITNAVKA